MTENRGECRACGRHMRLKKDGTLRHHAGNYESWPFHNYRQYRCKGAGQPPVTHGQEVAR